MLVDADGGSSSSAAKSAKPATKKAPVNKPGAKQKQSAIVKKKGVVGRHRGHHPSSKPWSPAETKRAYELRAQYPGAKGRDAWVAKMLNQEFWGGESVRNGDGSVRCHFQKIDRRKAAVEAGTTKKRCRTDAAIEGIEEQGAARSRGEGADSPGDNAAAPEVVPPPVMEEEDVEPGHGAMDVDMGNGGDDDDDSDDSDYGEYAAGPEEAWAANMVPDAAPAGGAPDPAATPDPDSSLEEALGDITEDHIAAFDLYAHFGAAALTSRRSTFTHILDLPAWIAGLELLPVDEVVAQFALLGDASSGSCSASGSASGDPNDAYLPGGVAKMPRSGKKRM